MSGKARVFIISPDAELCRAWRFFLAGRGWDAACFSCPAAAEPALGAAAGGALLVADADFAKELAFTRKRAGRVPVILFAPQGRLACGRIAAYLTEVCDDFITRDTDLRILEAKLKVLLRWAAPAAACAGQEVRSSSGRIRVDKCGHKVLLRRNGGFLEITTLTNTELEVLALLVGAGGGVVGRGAILETVWHGRVVNPENVDKHIEALRVKLNGAGNNIETVYGEGYCYRENA